jgi:hypothetical protein
MLAAHWLCRHQHGLSQFVALRKNVVANALLDGVARTCVRGRSRSFATPTPTARMLHSGSLDEHDRSPRAGDICHES